MFLIACLTIRLTIFITVQLSFFPLRRLLILLLSSSCLLAIATPFMVPRLLYFSGKMDLSQIVSGLTKDSLLFSIIILVAILFMLEELLTLPVAAFLKTSFMLWVVDLPKLGPFTFVIIPQFTLNCSLLAFAFVFNINWHCLHIFIFVTLLTHLFSTSTTLQQQQTALFLYHKIRFQG